MTPGLQERLLKSISKGMQSLGVGTFEIFTKDIVSRGAATYVLDPDFSSNLEFISGDAYSEMGDDVSQFILTLV